MKKIIPALFLLVVLFPILIYSAPAEDQKPQQPTPIVVVFFEKEETDPKKLHEKCEYVRFLEFRGVGEDRRRHKAQEYNLSVSSMLIQDLREVNLPVRIPLEGAFRCVYTDPSGFGIDPR